MLTLKKTHSDDIDFQNLVLELDKDLAKRNGEENDFFVQFNKSNKINYVIIAYNNQLPIGCGALKEYDKQNIEIKRMYVTPNLRGTGVAVTILNALENWAKGLGYTKCILETGFKMPEAIGLYKKNNFRVIANYAPYENITSSICFEKEL